MTQREPRGDEAVATITCQRTESSLMTEYEARRYAEAVADAMGITFYVVRNRNGEFQPVQAPPDHCEIVATVAPPGSVHESPHFDPA
jgi:hypothetical protein